LIKNIKRGVPPSGNTVAAAFFGIRIDKTLLKNKIENCKNICFGFLNIQGILLARFAAKNY
jgi:hypothetical protein